MLKKVFKWNVKKLCMATLGEILFAIGMNLFVVPMGLYTGGILGISQLIRSLIVNVFHVKVAFDIAGLINFILYPNGIPILVNNSKSYNFRI